MLGCLGGSLCVRTATFSKNSHNTKKNKTIINSISIAINSNSVFLDFTLFIIFLFYFILFNKYFVCS